MIHSLQSAHSAPVAQWIEQRFPKPCAGVQFTPGVPPSGRTARGLVHWPMGERRQVENRRRYLRVQVVERDLGVVRRRKQNRPCRA